MTDRATEVVDDGVSTGRRFARSGGGRSLRASALRCLRRADGPLPVATVAGRIVAERSESEPDSVSPAQVQRIYLALVRREVPALEQRGIVEYSPDDGTLELVGPGTP